MDLRNLSSPVAMQKRNFEQFSYIFNGINFFSITCTNNISVQIQIISNLSQNINSNCGIVQGTFFNESLTMAGICDIYRNQGHLDRLTLNSLNEILSNISKTLSSNLSLNAQNITKQNTDFFNSNLLQTANSCTIQETLVAENNKNIFAISGTTLQINGNYFISRELQTVSNVVIFPSFSYQIQLNLDNISDLTRRTNSIYFISDSLESQADLTIVGGLVFTLSESLDGVSDVSETANIGVYKEITVQNVAQTAQTALINYFNTVNLESQSNFTATRLGISGQYSATLEGVSSIDETISLIRVGTLTLSASQTINQVAGLSAVNSIVLASNCDSTISEEVLQNSLNFSNSTRSQYVYLLMEEWFM